MLEPGERKLWRLWVSPTGSIGAGWSEIVFIWAHSMDVYLVNLLGTTYDRRTTKTPDYSLCNCVGSQSNH